MGCQRSCFLRGIYSDFQQSQRREKDRWEHNTLGVANSSEYIGYAYLMRIRNISGISVRATNQVALHLLTDREKNDLAQLVDTMASYSITYKFSKQEPVQKIHHYGAASEVSDLSFDPPIDEFIRFQDYQSEHIGLSSAMKQVLVHEVIIKQASTTAVYD